KTKQSQVFFQGNPDASITTTERQRADGTFARKTVESYGGITSSNGELPEKATTYFDAKEKATARDVWDQVNGSKYQHLLGSDAAQRFFNGSGGGDIQYASQGREVIGKDGKRSTDHTIVATNAAGDRLVFATGKNGTTSAGLFSR